MFENDSEVCNGQLGNTYTYSVNDPQSDKERYVRAAAMDLR